MQKKFSNSVLCVLDHRMHIERQFSPESSPLPLKSHSRHARVELAKNLSNYQEPKSITAFAQSNHIQFFMNFSFKNRSHCLIHGSLQSDYFKKKLFRPTFTVAWISGNHSNDSTGFHWKLFRITKEWFELDVQNSVPMAVRMAALVSIQFANIPFEFAF